MNINKLVSYLTPVFNTLFWSWDSGKNQNIMLEIHTHSGLDPSCKNGDEDCWKFRNSHFWVLLHAWKVLLLHLKIIWNKRCVCVSTTTGLCAELLSFSFQIIKNHFHFWKRPHNSNTRLGVEQDVRSNNLFPYIIHQVSFKCL